MVSVIQYKDRPGKSKFDALAPQFGGRSDPEGWRLLPSWQPGGGCAHWCLNSCKYLCGSPVFHVLFPKLCGQEEGFAVACGILWRNLPLALVF